LDFRDTTPGNLRRLLACGADYPPEVGQRLKWFLYYVHTGSVSATCHKFRIARTTLYRWMNRFDPNDLTSLEGGSSGPDKPHQSAVPEDVVALIRRYRVRYPHIGKARLQQTLRQEHNILLSASSVGRVIERECLFFGDTPLHRQKRMEFARSRRRSVTPAPHEDGSPSGQSGPAAEGG
jgi:transposase-like protein